MAAPLLTIQEYYDRLVEERDRLVAPYNHQLDALLLIINSGHGDLPLTLPAPEGLDAPP